MTISDWDKGIYIPTHTDDLEIKLVAISSFKWSDSTSVILRIKAIKITKIFKLSHMRQLSGVV